MSTGFNGLNDDEVDKFNAILEHYGFSEDDFELIETREPTDSEEIELTKSEIKVLRKSLSIERDYYVVDKSMWLTEFKDDLKHGAFGQYDDDRHAFR